MSTHTQWQSLDLTHLLKRLKEVKRLLEQASALSVVQDAGRIQAMAETQRQKAKESNGNPHRRRYR
jgi:hypothetical protein